MREQRQTDEESHIGTGGKSKAWTPPRGVRFVEFPKPSKAILWLLVADRWSREDAHIRDERKAVGSCSNAGAEPVE